MLREITHYSLHFLAPGLIAYLLFRKNWKKVWLIILMTMLIDLDHILAVPIYDVNRCSINLHPLHTYWAGLVYIGLLFIKPLRIIGVGLLFHVLADALDCLWL